MAKALPSKMRFLVHSGDDSFGPAAEHVAKPVVRRVIQMGQPGTATDMGHLGSPTHIGMCKGRSARYSSGRPLPQSSARLGQTNMYCWKCSTTTRTSWSSYAPFIEFQTYQILQILQMCRGFPLGSMATVLKPWKMPQSWRHSKSLTRMVMVLSPVTSWATF